MRREIKVRCWNRGKMDYDCRDVTVWNGLLVAEGDGILMQFTGLRDRQGTEIYEGDIIRWGADNEYIAEVVWGRARPGFVMQKISLLKAGGYDALLTVYAGTEVIGNIYESPKLLEATG